VAVSRRWRIGLVTIAALALAATFNWAQNGPQNSVDVQFHAFQDTRSVTVLTPTIDLTKDFTDRSTLRVNFGVDAISAASDSCARCHREGVNSLREVGGLSVTRKFDDLKFTLGGAYSQENFYRSITGLTSISRDLAAGNTTIAGGFTFSLNRPTLHPTPQVENQYASSAFGSITQTLTKTTIAQVGYEYASIAGFQDNPFLRANVNGVMLVGHVPDQRRRQTISARVRQALPANTFLEGDFRRYVDDWQITSNALNVGLSHRFTPAWLASFAYRRYDQTPAYFYQPEYLGPAPQFFTADFRLEPFSSDNYTGRIVFTPAGRLLALPTGAGLTLQYDRYHADNGFDAAIFTAGVRLPLPSR
jgi:Protein of unknown function (DUF3570)